MEAFDRPAFKELCAGDEALMHEVLGVFSRELPAMLADVRDSVAAGDAEKIRRAAHRLKGALGAIVARPAMNAAHALEVGGVEGSAARLATLDAEVMRLTVAIA